MVKISWEKIKVISSVFATILIPIAVVLIANIYSKTINEKELSVRYVELAINILMEEPKEENKNIRKWAANIINYYSEVPMDEETLQDITEKQMLELYIKHLKEETRINNLSDEEVHEEFKNKYLR